MNFYHKAKAHPKLLLLLSLLSLGYMFLIQPDIQQYRHSLIRKNQLKNAMQAKETQIGQGQVLSACLSPIKGHFTQAHLFLSMPQALPNLLKTLAKTGGENGLVIEDFLLEKEINHEFYRETSIHLGLLGQYQQVLAFLKKITEKQQLLSLEDFDLFQAKRPGLPRGFLKLKAVIKIYRLKEVKHAIP